MGLAVVPGLLLQARPLRRRPSICGSVLRAWKRSWLSRRYRPGAHSFFVLANDSGVVSHACPNATHVIQAESEAATREAKEARQDTRRAQAEADIASNALQSAEISHMKELARYARKRGYHTSFTMPIRLTAFGTALQV